MLRVSNFQKCMIGNIDRQVLLTNPGLKKALKCCDINFKGSYIFYSNNDNFGLRVNFKIIVVDNAATWATF